MVAPVLLCPSGAPSTQRGTMTNKQKVKDALPTAKKTSDDLFWEAASQEREPAKILIITQQIEKAMKEHEKNVYP
jgi:hypothetical protein